MAALTTVPQLYVIRYRNGTDAVEQAEFETRARRRILDHPMLTAGQVASVLRRPESDRCVASRLRTAGKVVAFPVGNGYRYPEFQFDDTTASVRWVVATVNVLLGAGLTRGEWLRGG